ncbi:helix-turn-helix domain-containing protein [Paenibacillus sp. Leaf72]|uniref:helix-turn-helix domain-containing protein n=1 Tax=Paenibacillus sp. Leaf72 TaxID=1736234 RepID=UPI0006F2ED15|nr:helix-turn-helix transcriptional regulator [Paenibacillus sp. Leaf72]KQN96962.1 hypothetical protein ASF12_23110 [Paenibacillus sp. Leaf72]
MKIGEKVKYLRNLQGLTQGELAKECGVSKSLIIDIEKDTHKTSVASLMKICTALNISMSQFFEEENKRYSLDVVKIADYAELLTNEERKNLLGFLSSMINRTKS